MVVLFNIVAFENILRVLVKPSDVGFQVGVFCKGFVTLVTLGLLLCAPKVLVLPQGAASEVAAHRWEQGDRGVEGGSASTQVDVSRVSSSERRIGTGRRVIVESFPSHPASP